MGTWAVLGLGQRRLNLLWQGDQADTQLSPVTLNSKGVFLMSFWDFDSYQIWRISNYEGVWMLYYPTIQRGFSTCEFDTYMKVCSPSFCSVLHSLGSQWTMNSADKIIMIMGNDKKSEALVDTDASKDTSNPYVCTDNPFIVSVHYPPDSDTVAASRDCQDLWRWLWLLTLPSVTLSKTHCRSLLKCMPPKSLCFCHSWAILSKWLCVKARMDTVGFCQWRYDRWQKSTYFSGCWREKRELHGTDINLLQLNISEMEDGALHSRVLEPSSLTSVDTTFFCFSVYS